MRWRGMMDEFGDTTSILDLLYPTAEKMKPCPAGEWCLTPRFSDVGRAGCPPVALSRTTDSPGSARREVEVVSP